MARQTLRLAGMSLTVTALTNLALLPQSYAEIEQLVGAPLPTYPQGDAPSVQELVARTGQAQAVLVAPGTALPQEYVQACPQLRYIGVAGTSINTMDTDAILQQGITLTRVVDYGDEPTAEFILMQLVALARGVGQVQWRADSHELMGKSLGIVGLGALGQAVAHLALAYRMRVRHTSRSPKPEWEQRGVTHCQLGELLAASDIVVLTVPTDTLIMGSEQFAQMRPASILVQASLGRVIDPQAFERWIGRDGNAAIFDYAAGEQIYQTYHHFPRVVFPRIGAAYSIETQQRLSQATVANLAGWMQHQKEHRP